MSSTAIWDQSHIRKPLEKSVTMLANPANSGTDPQKGNLGLQLNANSNNPFLNPKPTSPAFQAPHTAPIRPSGTNPFLASFEQDLRSNSPHIRNDMQQATNTGQAPAIGDDAKELFKRLTVTDDITQDGPIPRTEVSRRPVPSSSSGHPRPNRSNEEPQYKKGPNGLRIPIKSKNGRDNSRRSGSKERRPRRNSESSTMDRPVMSAEEREARDRRRREREARHRERETSRDSRASEISTVRHSSRKKRQNAHVDVVDKLDVTGGLYGVGGMWHHDGPFDACRPLRNRKKDNLAPMGAFPTNSTNQTIGGSGPVNKNINLEQFHGRGTEGFHDYGNQNYDSIKPFAVTAAVVNPINRVEPVHGEETMGLGTSTFLEGAPASRQAIQRTRSEQTGTLGSLSRKKSIAMRIRGMSQSKGRYQNDSPALPSAAADKGRFQERSGGVALSDAPFRSPLPTPELPRPTTSRKTENNPFEANYDDAYEKKGASIKIAEAEIERKGSAAQTSPKHNVLERRATTDNNNSNNSSPEQKNTGGGFLNRVKSLKGPRRMKSERHPS